MKHRLPTFELLDSMPTGRDISDAELDTTLEVDAARLADTWNDSLPPK